MATYATGLAANTGTASRPSTTTRYVKYRV